jgi:20S proteasome alpha/beta subunit
LLPKKRLPNRRKAVTIIAGFCCDNGIVMCSDTEESEGYLKGSVQKLIPYQKDWCTAAMGGAGNGELIDALFEQVKERLDLEHADLSAIVAELKDVVLGFHEREVRAYPATDNEKRVI